MEWGEHLNELGLGLCKVNTMKEEQQKAFTANHSMIAPGI